MVNEIWQRRNGVPRRIARRVLIRVLGKDFDGVGGGDAFTDDLRDGPEVSEAGCLEDV